jgi:hypothetical protein
MTYAISEHPANKDFVTFNRYEEEQVSKRMAQLVTRIFTEKCPTETQQALKFEGEQALYNSFEQFGQIAGSELMANKEVSKATEKFTNYLDVDAFNRLFPE